MTQIQTCKTSLEKLKLLKEEYDKDLGDFDACLEALIALETNQEKMRQRCINRIDALYPLDSEWDQTREESEKAFIEAIRDDWRDLPLSVVLSVNSLISD